MQTFDPKLMETGKSLPLPIFGKIAYFAPADDQSAREVWRRFSSSLGLSAQDPAVFEGSMEFSPLVLHGDGKLLFFSVRRDAIAVGAIASYTDPMQVDDFKAAMDEALIETVASNFGTTTFLGADSPGAAAEIQAVFGVTSTGPHVEGLSPIKLGGGDHSFAHIAPESGKTLSFLANVMLAVDARLHKLEITVAHYREQMRGVLEKRKACDGTVASIMNERRPESMGDAERTRALEADVRRLAELYSDVLADLSLIRRSRDGLARDIRYLNDRTASTELGGLHFGVAEFADALEELKAAASRLDESLAGVQAAINVVSTKVELMRSRETVGLQKEALSLQVAAGFIEFILLFYYTFHSWEAVVGLERFEHMPAVFRVILTILFSGLSVAFTHEISKRLRGEKKALVPALFMLAGAVGTVLLMIALPYLTG
ncbi:MAG: hypothetical protein ACYC1U_09485 [Candidatus Aquicultorales bacterium]